MMFGFRSQFRMLIESENTQAIVCAHEHHSVARQAFAVEYSFRGRAREVPAAVDPQHHRLARFRRPFRRPDIDVETIFADSFASLHAPRAEVRGLANTGPRFHGHRFAPTQIAHGRSGKGNPFEHGAAAFEWGALNLPSGDHDCRRFLCRSHQCQERQCRHGWDCALSMHEMLDLLSVRPIL